MSKCTDCRYAEWQRTPTGRISKSQPGRCTWTKTVRVAAACLKGKYDNRLELRSEIAIWADHEFSKCPVFEPVKP